MPRKFPKIQASEKPHPVIGMLAEVAITAAEGDAASGPKKFDVLAYTGGALTVRGYDRPVVVDLEGMTFGKSLIANLDHDSTKRVGHVTATHKQNGQLRFEGLASAATAARDEVVNSAASGFVWQASIEAQPTKLIEVAAGKSVQVNGQSFDGPIYVARKSVSKGFGFVTHGADDNTSVTIAATADKKKERSVDKEFKKWIEAMGFVADELSETQLEGLKANYEGKQVKPVHGTVESVIASATAEAERQQKIADITGTFISACGTNGANLEMVQAVQALARQAVEAKWTPEKYDLELLRLSRPVAAGVFSKPRSGNEVTTKLLQAAICQAGRLPDLESNFDDQTLQAAHDRFKGRISLGQVFMLCAEANGYRGDYASKITTEVQNAAFNASYAPRSINASGFSTVSIANVLSNVSNKFLMVGWNAVDMTPLRIANVRNVTDFKEITTVSLTGDLQFEKVGATGEIKHGSVGDKAYGNKADTYAKMLAISRQDMINDDLGALTSVPQRLGRGSALKLNDIFWTEFLNNATTSWFHSTNNNVNTGVADMTVGGLSATEKIFMDQVDYDSKPLGIMPAILVVPTALKTSARTLMTSELLIDGTATATQGNKNPWTGRFRVESSPYMSNSSYTGYDAAAWYMLADPNDLPFIEIVALNGRVEPVVESADAAFNVLGVEMRGYSDIGVRKQEKKAGVRADGGSS